MEEPAERRHRKASAGLLCAHRERLPAAVPARQGFQQIDVGVLPALDACTQGPRGWLRGDTKLWPCDGSCLLPRSRHSNIKLSEPLPLRGRARRGLGALPLGVATLAHKQWPFALFAGPLAGPLLGDWRPFAGIPPSLLGSENPFPAASCRQQVTGSNLHCNHHCAVTVIIISGTQAQWVGCERCPGIWNVHSPHPGGDAAQSARRRVLAPNQRIASTGCWMSLDRG